ncbi:septum formation initiator family protein [candidate division WOR-3 bacterium]|nr:septum formation initiator family protein [candidate division WOR-3 bacterium]
MQKSVNLKKIVTILFWLGVIYFLVFSKHGLIKIIHLEWQVRKTQNEIRILEAKEVVMKREVRLLKSDTAYINRAAREKFGIE